MKLIYNVKILIIYLILFSSCNSKPENTNQNKQSNLNEKKLLIGGGCDGCELMYNGMPSNIHSTDTSPGWYEKGQKLLITGTIFEIDGRTPAANIIIYYWQTDNNGYYSPINGRDENTKRKIFQLIFILLLKSQLLQMSIILTNLFLMMINYLLVKKEKH